MIKQQSEIVGSFSKAQNQAHRQEEMVYTIHTESSKQPQMVKV